MPLRLLSFPLIRSGRPLQLFRRILLHESFCRIVCEKAWFPANDPTMPPRHPYGFCPVLLQANAKNSVHRQS